MFKRNEEGASAVEYGLLVALIAAVMAIAVVTMGTTVRDVLFDQSETTISDSTD